MLKSRTSLVVISIVLVVGIVLGARAFQAANPSQIAAQSRPVGMGDLRYAEAQGTQINTIRLASNDVGTLVRRSSNSQAVIPVTGANSTQEKTGGCPSLSSSANEHDSGASSPDYVLNGLSC